jgi:hypothetical protein
MSNFKYTSWGRTRRPKNITGMDRAYVTGALSIANLQENTPAGGFTESPNNNSSYLPVGIYETENQRFCHIMTSGSATVTNMYIYNYAAGFWSEMLTGSLGGPVVVGGTDSPQYKIVEIAGADLVALNTGSAGKISLSFSTF